MLQLAAKQVTTHFTSWSCRCGSCATARRSLIYFTITVAGQEERGLIGPASRLRDALASISEEAYCRAPAQLLGPAPAARRPRR